jgi:hypothetical protein
MRLFILILALAIVAFSTVAAAPTEEKKGYKINRVPSATNNQKRDCASTSNWKRGDPICGVPTAFNNKRSLMERQSNCLYEYHYCYDNYGGCCIAVPIIQFAQLLVIHAFRHVK